MKRLFSGAKSPTLEFLAPPKTFQNSDDKPRSRSSSFSKIFSSNESSPHRQSSLPPIDVQSSKVPPELVPIVTLLSAQAHRRYCEGVFLILKDLNSDGTPANRAWKEVYGVLIGTQLAIWDARLLAENGNNAEELMRATAKPTYVNFTDSNFRPLESKDAVLAEGKKKFENTLVVSTTLKNRYFLQFSDKEAFSEWYAAFRLSAFEFTALQEAYTGAFLSTKGAKLGDIKVILADTKFDYEDWVSVRFGAGMPWKRCYAVVSQPTKKSSKKRICGEVNFYENEKKTKKSQAMTTVTDASAVYAIYPSSPVLIDTSTMIKLEGTVSFGKKDTPKPTDIFIMPEKHYAVPGYDTIIRFLIPAMNAFQLYGRPKRLIADKTDFGSLLFGLPTLPHVHYLQVQDLLPLSNSISSKDWSALEWREQVKRILQKKLSQGYTGCGSMEGLTGALASPAIGSNELFDSTPLQTSPLLASISKFPDESNSDTNSLSNASRSGTTLRNVVMKQSNSEFKDSRSSYGNDKETPTTEYPPEPFKNIANARSFTSPSQNSFSTPRNSPRKAIPTIDIQDSNFKSFGNRPASPAPNEKSNLYAPNDKLQTRKSELSTIYDKYSQMPSGFNEPPSSSVGNHDRQRDSAGAYNEYMGSPKVKKFDISNLRDSNSTDRTEMSRTLHVRDEAKVRSNISSEHTSPSNIDEQSIRDDVLEDFYSLSQQISKMGLENKTEAKDYSVKDDIDDFNFEAISRNTIEDNVFDPDYMEQNQMLETESNYTTGEQKFQYGNESVKGSQQSIDNIRNRNPYLKSEDSLPVNNGYGRNVNGISSNYTPEALPKQRIVNPSGSPGYKQFPPATQNPAGMKHSPAYANLHVSSTSTVSKQQGNYAMPPRPPPQNAPHQNGGPYRRPAPYQGQQQMAYPPNYPHPKSPAGQQFAVQNAPARNPQYSPYHSAPYNGAPPPGGQMYGAAPPQQYVRQAVPPQQKPKHIQPIPGQKINSQKPRSPMTGGFSQFMPSTANNQNPYSANPYSK